MESFGVRCGECEGRYDGGVVFPQVSQVVFAVADSNRSRNASVVKDKAVVYGRDIRFFLIYVNHYPAQAVGSVDLGHGTFEDAQTGNIKPLEEYLAYSFVRMSRKTWRN